MARPKAPPKEKKPIVTTKAPEVEALARELIAQDHPTLADAGIKYGFIGEGKRQKEFGKVVLVPEPLRTLLERPNVQFVLVVSPAHWKRMDDMQRRQALDALLCAISFDGKMPRREKPDATIFRANIMRYKGQGEALEEVFRGIQLILPEMAAADAEPPSVTIEMGDTKAVLTPETAKNITKALGGTKEQKPRMKGVDGLGNPLPTPKRGAKATGPQQPTAGG